VNSDAIFHKTFRELLRPLCKEDPVQSKWTLPVAVAAGFIGGVLSNHLHLPLVQAQDAAQSAPQELRTQKLVLVGPKGETLGVLTGSAIVSLDPSLKGRLPTFPDGRIHLFDGKNKEIWSVPPTARMTPLSGTQH
jgi:hypothetical protein